MSEDDSDSYDENDDPDIGTSELDHGERFDQPRTASARVPMSRARMDSKAGVQGAKNGGAQNMNAFFIDTFVVPNYPSIN